MFHPIRSRDGSLTLYSHKYRQTFGSTAGARTEALWVYLQGSGIEQRLRESQQSAVLEVGLGTGLNFLVTAESACRHRVTVDYIALEADLASLLFWNSEAVRSCDSMSRLLCYRPLANWWALTVKKFFKATPGTILRFNFPPFIRLEVRVGEATQTAWPERTFDAIYHDAFSPQMNPELWTTTFLRRLADSLAVGGSLVSYCVQGEVRRRLQATGLRVQRRPGPPGGKREVLRATKPFI